MTDAEALGGKVLVTGASGFIGSHLVRRLVAAGDVEVHAVSRRRPCDDRKEIHWWDADLAETAAVDALLAAVRPDTIFHLASVVAGQRDLDLVLPTFRSNLVSTVNLLAAAAHVGCRRIILTGSLEEPERGDADDVPCSPYAASKWAGSAYARMFHRLYQLPAVVLRVFMVYGPGQRDLRKLIPYTIGSVLRGEAPRLTSGAREIDWIYVDDVVEGFLAAARAPGVEGETLDIGSGELISIRRVVERLVGMINPRIEPRFGALPERPLDQVRRADAARSEAIIGWRAATVLDDGLKRTVEWYVRRNAEPPVG